MPRARIAFVNTYNLFPPGAQIARPVPVDAQALQSKLLELQSMVGGVVPPTFLGLCEVAEERYAQEIVALLPGNYSCLWAPPNHIQETGLALLYRPDEVVLVQPIVVSPHQRRPHWLAALFQMRQGSRAPLWIVVNHWPSQRNPEARRLQVSQELGEFWQRTGRVQTNNAILMGDFNCEPFDLPFRQSWLPWRGTRSRSYALRPGVQRSTAAVSWFYGPMWRCLGDSLPGDLFRETGTWRREVTEEWRMYDHFWVEPRLLSGGQIDFEESTLQLVHPTTDATDHCAILADLIY